VARQQDNGLGVAGSVWIDRNTVMGALTPRKALAAERLPPSAIGGDSSLPTIGVANVLVSVSSRAASLIFEPNTENDQ